MRKGGATVCIAVGVLLGACVDLGPYQCVDDEQCRSGRAPGVCEATGYCSYSDTGCDSGRRYSDLAGPFARQCVPPQPGGGSSTSTTEGSSSDEGTSTSTGEASSSSTGPGIPGCGNGVVEDDEECDELDAIDGDGCNTDCVASGSIRWSVTVGSDSGGNDRYYGLMQLESGDLVAVGYMQAETRDVLIGRYTVDGEEVARVVHDIEGEGDEAESITQDGVGRLYVCGRALVGGSGRPWIGRWDAALTGAPEVDQTLPAAVNGYCHGLATIEGSQLVAVGGNGFQAWAYSFTPTTVGSGTVAIPVPPAGASGQSRLKAATRGPAGEVMIAGQDEEVGVAFEAVAPDDLGPSLMLLPETQLQSMIVTSDTILVAGWHASAASLDDRWISAHERDGTQRWAWNPGRELLVDEVEDIALDGAGNIYAVGHISSDDPDRWVGKLDPEGNLVWERSDFPDSAGPDRGRSIVVLPDGDLVIAAEITTDAGDLDGWLARLAP